MYLNKYLCATVVALLTWQSGVNSEQIISNEVGVTGGSSNPVKQHTSFVSSVPSPSPSQATPVAGGGNEYRATYFYPHHHQQNWNRDTYADAASDFGYNQQAGSVPGAVYSPAYGNGDIDGNKLTLVFFRNIIFIF